MEKHNYDLQVEKQMKSTLKKQQNIHETIFGSVPASAANKTKLTNKRPREDQTPNGRTKLVRLNLCKLDNRNWALFLYLEAEC